MRKQTINHGDVNKLIDFTPAFVDKNNRFVGPNKPNAMLEMCKEILTKVSFDRVLFQKELMKALNWLSHDEIDRFREWCLNTFGKKYPEVLKTAFAAH